MTVPSPYPYCHPAVTSHPVESQCNKRKGDGVTVINQHSHTSLTPSRRPHVRLPSPSRTSLRASDLPLTSFRFHLTMDTLVFGCALAAIRPRWGLAPVRLCPCRANKKKGPALSGQVLIKVRCVKSYLLTSNFEVSYEPFFGSILPVFVTYLYLRGFQSPLMILAS